MLKESQFKYGYLHPKYWLTWFALCSLWLLVQLPYPCLRRLGSWSGLQSRRFLRRRDNIAKQNLALCFPELSDTELEKMIVKNFRSLGMGLVETGMAWFWSDKRLRRWFDVEGLVNLQQANAEARGVIAIGVHFMSLELGGRIMGICQPMIAIYRPHNNKVMEWAQTQGRLRSNKRMIDRRQLREMVNALKQGETVWFAPDQDYGPKGSGFAPFFAVEQAATTNGTFVIARLSGASLLTISMIRKSNGTGYRLIISPELRDYPCHDEAAAAVWMNKVIEGEILRAPEQYLWVHRRFKTRPEGQQSLYT